MNTSHSLFCIPAVRRTTALAGPCLALLMCLAAPTAFADPPVPPEPPTDRFCMLMAMLGNLPPQCMDDHDELPAEVQSQLDDLQLAVLPFFSYDVAVTAGWDTILGECVESPMGGMGYHVHNMDQLQNGQLNLLRPEVLLYAPTEDGSMQFHGVEYIIPGELWESEEPPQFLGRALHFNPNVGPFGIWALHVWVGTPNPEGIFEDFNPEVNCEFAHEPE